MIHRAEQAQSHARFEQLADDNLEVLQDRLEGFDRVLDAGAGLFVASDFVTAADFRNFTQTLNLQAELPGILGFGHVGVVRLGELDVLEERTQRRGLPLPPIHPPSGRAERFVIEMIEPRAGNETALGLDVGFEAGRRAALFESRRSNTTRMTPPIVLVQDEDERVSYVLFRPIFAEGTDLSTRRGRTAGFRGWVHMPFVGEMLFNTLSRTDTEYAMLTALDADATGEAVTVYSDAAVTQPERSAFATSRAAEIFGRNWTLNWHSTPAFEAAYGSWTKWLIGALGLALSVMIARLLGIVAQRERRIESEVKRKTRELQAKTDETQSVLQNAVVAIFVLDQNQRILSANQTAHELFRLEHIAVGTPLRDLLNLDPCDGTSDEEATSARSPLRPSLRLLVQKNLWETARGEPRATVLVQDVGEREAAARRIKANEARWNLALEGAQIGVFDVDLMTNTSVVSDTWRELMRISPDEEDPQAVFFSRIHPEDIEIVRQADRACRDGLTRRSRAEYRVIDEDGSVRWMKADAVVVSRDAAGTALRLIGAQMDITDLRATQDALQASRERFELVLKHAPVGTALLSSDGRLINMNEALCSLTGYSEETLRKRMTFADLITEEDLQTMLEAIADLRAQGQSSYEGEHQILPRVGAPIWGLLSVAWAFDPIEQGEIYIVQINDITEKKMVDTLKSEFVATVSHELRTPLTSVKGALGLLRGPMLPAMPDGSDRLLEIAASNTDRLTALVNDILDLEKISSGQSQFQIEPTDMAPVLSASVEQMLPFAVQHHVTVELDVPNDPVFALVDAPRTQQLIANLVSNACKYSDNDTVVHVRLEAVDGKALVCVLNTGPAITNEFKTRIFEPFSQEDASDTRAKGGTGLGLNISRQIVERMGGEIGFSSVEGQPTAFWFTVPLTDEDTSQPVPANTDKADGPHFKVLHLEDDRDFAEIVRKGLGDRAQMTSVMTIAAARIAMQADTFDLVVIDWDLPDGHGGELLDDVGRLQPQARIISLSATESSVRDLRVDQEIIKSRANLDDIVSRMVRYARTG
ncbi:CHASE domain-containing protein [Thalassorhabdomicrobium marinisediminis]|uniref:histidine kinase n=1 Tax=Thalassorhabdomicrobium marinisediminis TaxID=2170577 RepID=A0A2T7FZK6_9RHOB|nr:CHASE domain-containing protein [Thalassorhabdomicrobium marinisediminis]PVA07592.1 hybrid sensor histidine kinase/response regulator [Thalassorhabdomicrobium marinisediminis]